MPESMPGTATGKRPRGHPPYRPAVQIKWPQVKLLKSMCQEAGISTDLYAKDSIRLWDLPKLLRLIAMRYRPLAWLDTDRVSILIWLLGLEREIQLVESLGRESKLTHAGYLRRLEVEIHRIAGLKQPARTIAATELRLRLKEAASVVDAGRRYAEEEYVRAGGVRGRVERVRKMMDGLKEIAAED